MPQATILSSAPSQTRSTPRRWPRRALALPVAAVALAGAVAVSSRRFTPAAVGPAASISITSMPGGVAVLIDGKTVGTTPANLTIVAGQHQVTLRRPDLMAVSSALHVTAGQTLQLDTSLWDRTATITDIRPPFPGSTISKATFLADGRLALDITLPPGNDHQLWLRKRDGGMERIGPADAAGPMVVTPDGQTVAYLMPMAPASPAQAGTVGGQRLTTVWTVGADGHGATLRHVLPPSARSTQLTDLAWAPDGAHLLLVGARQDSSTGARNELLWRDPIQGTARTLLNLPTTIVPGSYLWSPEGDRLALLTRAGALQSLCLVGVQDQSFRYLADLQPTGSTPLLFPPLAWSPDSHRAVYAAGVPSTPTTLGGWRLGDHSASGLFTTEVAGATSRRLGTILADAPVWRADGSVLALVHANGSVTRSVAAVDVTSGLATPVGTLPLSSGSPAAVRWDAVHAQALIAQPQNGNVTYTLATFGSEAAR